MNQNEIFAIGQWQYLTTFCHTSDCCPQAFWSDVAPGEMALKITDDWGYDASFQADNPPNELQFRKVSHFEMGEYGITHLEDPNIQYVMLTGESGMAFMTEGEASILLDEINELVDKQRVLSR